MKNTETKKLAFYHQAGGEVIGMAFKQVAVLFGIECRCRQMGSNLFGAIKKEDEGTDVVLFWHQEPSDSLWSAIIELLNKVDKLRVRTLSGITSAEGSIAECLEIKPTGLLNVFSLIIGHLNFHSIKQFKMNRPIFCIFGRILRHSLDHDFCAVYLAIARSNLERIEHDPLWESDVKRTLKGIFGNDFSGEVRQFLQGEDKNFKSKKLNSIWRQSLL